MGLVELEPEDLSIAFVELELVLGFVPLSELGVGFGIRAFIGSPNGGSDAIAEILRVDVSVEAVEEEDGDFEEDYQSGERDRD